MKLGTKGSGLGRVKKHESAQKITFHPAFLWFDTGEKTNKKLNVFDHGKRI